MYNIRVGKITEEDIIWIAVFLVLLGANLIIWGYSFIMILIRTAYTL